LDTNRRIKNYLNTASTDKFPNAYIYLFNLPPSHEIVLFSEESCVRLNRSAPHFLKIGYSKDPVQRIATWTSKCKFEPNQPVSYKIQHAYMVERLVQLQLHNDRWREVKCPTPTCQVNHNEFFYLSREEAKAAIKMWSNWLRLKPYTKVRKDGSGGGLKAYWAERLDMVKLDTEDDWEWFVEGREPL